MSHAHATSCVIRPLGIRLLGTALLSLLSLELLFATPAAAQFQIQPLVGPSYSADSIEFGGGQWQCAGHGSVPWNQVREIRFPTASDAEQPKPIAATWDIGLIGGGRLKATSANFDGESLTIACGLGTLQLPIELLVSIRRSDVPIEKVPTALLDEDQLLVQVEGQIQTVQGLLESITDTSILFSSDSGSGAIPLDRISGLVMASAGAITHDEGLRFVFRNGEAVFGLPADWVAGSFEIDLFGLGDLRVDTRQIERIETQTSRLVYLSSLDPKSERISSLLLEPKPWQRDRSVLGDPLQLTVDDGTRKTVTYTRGLGLASVSELSFDVDGFDRFAAVVGIHATSIGQGSCDLIVRIDGRERWRQTLVSSEIAIPIDLDITGGKTLTLVVEAGERLDLGDHVDLADARLVKTAE